MLFDQSLDVLTDFCGVENRKSFLHVIARPEIPALLPTIAGVQPETRFGLYQLVNDNGYILGTIENWHSRHGVQENKPEEYLYLLRSRIHTFVFSGIRLEDEIGWLTFHNLSEAEGFLTGLAAAETYMKERSSCSK